MAAVRPNVALQDLPVTTYDHTTYAHPQVSLHELTVEFSSGLDIVTTAIFNSTTDFVVCKEKLQLLPGYKYGDADTSSIRTNALLANGVRDVAQRDGWIAGWKLLSQIAPECGLHKQFMDDTVTCSEIYSRIRVSPNVSRPIDVGITVTSPPNIDSLTEIGPKGLGGKAWQVDPDYAAVRERWSYPGYAPMGPCTAFGWNGAIKKSVRPEDEIQCRAMQMLGTVDYDFDLEAANNVGFANSLNGASKHVLKTGSNIQRGAIGALLNNDLQRFVRSVQMKWVKEGAGSLALGPEDVSVDEYVKANALDCAAIMGFAYQDPSRHELSRKCVFIGNLLANMHDSLYDMGCSSRMSTVLYARGAGVARYDVHRATVAVAISCFDNIAHRNRDMRATDTPPYGDSMGNIAFSWSAFNGRYRTWERFVKYRRQLKRSKSAEAQAVLDAANKCLVFVEDGPDADMATTWTKALSPDGAKYLTKRKTQAYIPPAGHEILNTPGVQVPDLCTSCEPLFRNSIFAAEGDEVHGVEGLPASVTSCRALGLAAAIRRSAIFATNDKCCDVCACRIGNWGDSVAYKVMVALMKSEEETAPNEWLLQHHIVACVDLWPVSVPSVLAGFDMVGELKYDNGAMGIRDVVDC